MTSRNSDITYIKTTRISPQLEALIYRNIAPECRDGWRKQNAEHYYAIAKSITGDGGSCYIATRDNDVIGYIIASGASPNGTVEVIDIYVTPAMRRRHIGDRLMGIVENWARNAGARRLTVQSSTNESTQQFYRKQSMRAVAVIYQKNF